VVQLAMEQGEGAHVLGARCRAGVRELRGQARSRYTGTPLRALRGLGVQTGTRRRGRDGSHGHARVIPLQGIGRGLQREASGEVTGRETVGLDAAGSGSESEHGQGRVARVFQCTAVRGGISERRDWAVHR
jgi:hypothetical protein